VREETQLDTCIYCKKPITRQELPAMRMSATERAHVTCYLEHNPTENKKNEKMS
jgi:hypothetical protein